MPRFMLSLKPSNSFLCLIILLLLSAHGRADCFSRNGVRVNDPGMIYCGNNTNNCCLPGQKCGSNMLCISQSTGAITREYCADKSWQGCSAACADGFDAGRDMTQCPAGSNFFCCGKCECNTSPLVFVDPLNGALGWVADKSPGVSPIWWDGTNSTVLVMSRTSSQVASSSATASMSISGTAVGSTPLSTSTTAADKSSSPALPPGAYAGIGVGSTVAVAIVAALVWLFIRERRKRRSYEEQMSQSQAPPVFYHDESNKGGVVQTHTPSYGLDARQELGSTQRHEMS
ncbi:hypothetical protein BKA63DRAFT_508255 [Paraphoma chrysanthemicola]|nr:hypothetical protein BKA63DRAFT_508255 [Paraphoma chrysanthemicola]